MYKTLTALGMAALMALLIMQPGAATPVEIILDNGSASFVGEWTIGTMSTDKYGADYQFIQVATGGGATATYTPTISATSGDWQVFAWYPQGSNRPTQARYVIHTASGDTVRYLNQQTNGGTWQDLGTYTMAAGTGNYAQVTNLGTETTKVVLADAIRFYSASGGAPDTTPPVISAVSASPGYNTATITWTTDEGATSQVEYGSTTSYGYQTTKDTNLVTGHSVQLSGLDPSALYHYRVKSEDFAGNPSTSGDYTFTTSSTLPSSLRASWLDSWGEGFHSSSEVTSVINQLYNNNYNALIFEARKRGDACYDSAYEPWATGIDPGFDPLGDMITKGHALGMEIHAWLVAYRIASTNEVNAPPIYWEHKVGTAEDWIMRNSSGAASDGTNYHFDPGVPGVQDYTCKVVLDIVTHYDVDGINFDYIRYPGNLWGYNDFTRQRFYNEYGYYPPTSTSDSHWSTWCDYRRQQVTDLVKKCYLEVMAVRPDVKMSICGVTWGGISNFTSTSSYTSVFQDWRKWMQDHIIDLSIPMDYKREHDSTQANDYRDWCDFAINNRNGRQTNIDQGSYLNSIANSLIQLDYALDQGADGVSTYDYWSTNNEGKTKEEFYDAVKTNLFSSPAAVPDMPWKSAPTTGIIFGTVTDASKPDNPIYKDWIYKATVQVTGPVTRSTTTDGTGTYGFIDLPPGTYTVTCSKSGFTTRTYTTQTILAGDVLRDDFDLSSAGQIGVSSPSSTIYQAGKSLFSLPYEPIDPDPAVVMAGIPIDGLLVQWHRATQSSRAYDEWDPDFFGNLSLDQGYWLTVDSPRTITYQAYPGYAGSREQSLPKAGWNIIGCPFPTEHKWADMRITNGTTTVSLEEARDNGWLNSVGVWWDSVNQSSRDVGLPDDWCYTDNLQPWHGHWFRTYIDDLSLTQR